MLLRDAATGLVVATLCSWLFGFQSGCPLIVAGLAGAILPDWDMVAYLLFGGKLDKFAHRHRDISHYPPMTITFASLLVWHYAGWEHGVVIAIAIFLHYVMDSGSVGWGIQWLGPLVPLYFAYRAVEKEPARFHVWTKKQQDHAANLFGENNWAKNPNVWKHEILELGCATVVAYIHFQFKC